MDILRQAPGGEPPPGYPVLGVTRHNSQAARRFRVPVFLEPEFIDHRHHFPQTLGIMRLDQIGIAASGVTGVDVQLLAGSGKKDHRNFPVFGFRPDLLENLQARLARQIQVEYDQRKGRIEAFSALIRQEKIGRLLAVGEDAQIHRGSDLLEGALHEKDIIRAVLNV
jgi:hypothetical protein